MKKHDNFAITIIILVLIGFIINVVISAIQFNFSALIAWSLATVYFVIMQLNHFYNK